MEQALDAAERDGAWWADLLAGAWLHRQGARALFGDWARPSFVEDPELTALKELLRAPDHDQDPRR